MKLVFKSMLFVILLLALVVVGHRLGQVRYPVGQNALQKSKQAPVLVVAGSSHGGAFDAELFDIPAVNLSIAGADVYEMSYRLRYAVTNYESIRCAVIVLSPFTFFYDNNSLIDESGAQPRAANRMQTYIDYPMWELQDDDLVDFILAKLYPLSTLDHWAQFIFPSSPVELVAKDWTKTELNDYARRRVAEIRETHENMKQNHNGDLVESAYNVLLETIAFLQSHDVKVVMITPPYWDEYYRLLKDDFLMRTHERALEIERATGVQYLDYSHDQNFRAKMNLFFDSDHLNAVGEQLFHDLFVQDLAKISEFAPHMKNELGGAVSKEQ